MLHPSCSFTISDAALSRLITPTAKSRSTSSNQPLVDELTQIARTRLSSADVLRLRDQLTSILESHSGAPASAVTAVRASRGFEAQLKAQKPVSVRDVCLAFPMWPFAVQAQFFKQLCRLGKLAFTADDEEAGANRPPLPVPDDKAPSVDASALGSEFAGLQGVRSSMLQPLGLALPALRLPSGRPTEGTTAPAPSEAGAPEYAAEGEKPHTPRGSKRSNARASRSPRLVVMSRS